MQSRFANVADRTTPSTVSGRKTALMHFNKFLVALHSEVPSTFAYTTFDAIPAAQLLHFRAVFGRFPTYLKSDANIKKGGTNLLYVSKMQCVIKEKCPTSDITDDKWYSTLRYHIKAEYNMQCAETGETYSDSAPPMTREDHLYCARLLFGANTNEAFLDRDLLNKLRQSLGRVTEIAHIKCRDYSLYKGRNSSTLSAHIKRIKTGVEQDLTMFMDRDSYLLCPLHSLATVIALSASSDEIFPQISEKSEAQYVNRLLSRLCEQASLEILGADHPLTKALTSHSPRHGSATEANEHPMIQTSWIVPRGGWTLSRMEQIFAYIAGTRKTDVRVARVLSGWPDPDYGGAGLTIECIPAEDRELFRMYCTELLGCAQFSAQSRTALSQCLCCVLILHYSAVKADYPNSILVERMESTTIVSPEKLEMWCTAVQAYWKRQNSQFLPLSSFEAGDVSFLFLTNGAIFPIY